MKKINWKSVLPLVIALTAPLYQAQLAKVGVKVAPATISPLLAALGFVSVGSFVPLVQSFALLVGGLLAHGAFEVSTADLKTNFAGIAAAACALLAALGLHVAPEVQQAIGSFGTALILTFSSHPEVTPEQ